MWEMQYFSKTNLLHKRHGSGQRFKKLCKWHKPRWFKFLLQFIDPLRKNWMEEKMMKFEPLQFTPPPPTNPTPSLSNFCTKEQKCTLLSGSQYTQGAKPARRGKWCNKLPQFSVRVNNVFFVVDSAILQLHFLHALCTWKSRAIFGS